MAGRGRTPRGGLLAMERARMAHGGGAGTGSGWKSGRGCTQCTTAAVPRGLVVQGGPARRSACDAARLIKESPMAQWNLSGLVRTSDLPVAAKTGSPARRRLGVMSRQLPRWDRWDRWVDSVEACCAPLRAAAWGGCARCPKRCATKRRFSTDLAAALARVSPPRPPIMGTMGVDGTDDGRREAGHRRRRGVFCGRSFAYSAAPPVPRAGPPGAGPCRPAPGPLLASGPVLA